MKQAVQTIQQFIDMDIVPFIEDLTEKKSFSDINSLIHLMDMEKSRLLENRVVLAKLFATQDAQSDEFKQTFLQYVGSFVLEQKIIDRRDVAKHIMDMKGEINKMLQRTSSEQKAEGAKSPTAVNTTQKRTPKPIA